MNKVAFSVEDDIRRMQDEVFQLRLKHVVLVEGKRDESFWELALNQAIPDKFKIYSFVNFPSDGTSSKTTLVAYYVPSASQNLIICLDSDYDYLLDNPAIQKSFVFQTYVHSIENFQCYAPSLADILCEGVQAKQINFDFERYFAAYSETVYPWLVCQLFAKQNGQETELTNPPIPTGFNQPDENLKSWAELLNEQIKRRFQEIKQTDEGKKFISQLVTLGLTSQNAYLFIRGHNVFEKLTLKLLKGIAGPIVEQLASKLSNSEKARFFAYQKQHPFEKLLRKNSNFESCLFYQKIIADLTATFSDQTRRSKPTTSAPE